VNHTLTASHFLFFSFLLLSPHRPPNTAVTTTITVVIDQHHSSSRPHHPLTISAVTTTAVAQTFPFSLTPQSPLDPTSAVHYPRSNFHFRPHLHSPSPSLFSSVSRPFVQICVHGLYVLRSAFQEVTGFRKLPGKKTFQKTMAWWCSVTKKAAVVGEAEKGVVELCCF